MNTSRSGRRSRRRAVSLLFVFLMLSGCGGDDDGGPQDDQTGATLQGTVTAFDAGQGARVSPAAASLASLAVPGVTVAIGSKSRVTDALGSFSFTDIPLGDRPVTLSKDGAMGTYLLADIESGEAFLLDEIQYSGGQVATKHTGTWVGTGGSSDPGSAGQIALTMVLEANGNSLTGTASVEPPDNTVWSIIGTETGSAVSGTMSVTSSDSECAAGVEFEGTFSGSTLSGTFVEVNPPAGCGTPESGTFEVEKQ